MRTRQIAAFSALNDIDNMKRLQMDSRNAELALEATEDLMRAELTVRTSAAMCCFDYARLSPLLLSHSLFHLQALIKNSPPLSLAQKSLHQPASAAPAPAAAAAAGPAPAKALTRLDRLAVALEEGEGKRCVREAYRTRDVDALCCPLHSGEQKLTPSGSHSSFSLSFFALSFSHARQLLPLRWVLGWPDGAV